MGSWTGKYDPLRKLHESAKKNLGFDPSIARTVHTKIADKAHKAADDYTGANQKVVRTVDYSGALSAARSRADRARMTIMRSV